MIFTYGDALITENHTSCFCAFSRFVGGRITSE